MLGPPSLGAVDPKAWRYEFEAWVLRLGGLPTELLASKNRSEGYEMNQMHVFKIRPGRYAVVWESGCSCYEARNAGIFIYGRKAEALADFKRWEASELFDQSLTGIEVKD